MMLLNARRRLRIGRSILLALLFCSVYFTSNQLLSLFRGRRADDGFVASSSNSTLGFGRIYVVSKPGSPRRKSIVQAANVTELQLSIPVQPVWTEDDVRNSGLATDAGIGRGSLLAWLGHIHALQQ